MEYKGQTTLFDRVAVGSLYGIVAFITYSVIWLVIVLVSGATFGMPPFFINFALIFSFILFLLGLFNLDKYVFKILKPIWSGLEKVLNSR